MAVERVVRSDEVVVDLEVEEMEAGVMNKKMRTEDGSAAVRWERFLPTAALRVLLVEADDSTRQIIAALLRKCDYRVTAVPDGLKAWEVLKGKPHNIDLILTEIELPSISGFALLTLVMEHETCKNVPVIVMSLNDSVSTVYKCMMRGAADFLVKPLRKNELRNLWQHVWRRQASPCGPGAQNENVAQQKVETTGENSAASNQSTGCTPCSQRNKDCVEKGKDAQSSCTKPDSEDNGKSDENMKDISQPKSSKSSEGDMTTLKHEECVESASKVLMQDCEDIVIDANAMAKAEDMVAESRQEHACISTEAIDNHIVLVSCAREAIDLIGGFDNYPKCSYRSFENISSNKVGSSLLLDLSLRRPNPSGSVNQVNDERQTLNHSDASAFSRYINLGMQPLHSSASNCNQQKDHRTNPDTQSYAHTTNSNTHDLAQSSPENMLSLGTGQYGQSEVAYPCTQKAATIPIPMSGIRFDNLCTPNGAEVRPVFFTQSGLATVENPGLARNQELTFQANSFHPYNPETSSGRQLHNLVDQNGTSSLSQTEHKKGYQLESSQDQRNFSSVTDQSGSSSFCNSNGNVDQVAVVRNATESGNENNHRSVQREVALTKFRLKRKDRCYEKKVRYESRKKLAEQRPRVKGQFVRHVHIEPELVESQSCS